MPKNTSKTRTTKSAPILSPPPQSVGSRYSALLSRMTAIRSQKLLLYVSVVGIALGLGLSLSILLFNLQERRFDTKFEANFVDPRQAIIFWRTEKPSIGFVKYGPNKSALNATEYQTTSQPSEIHAVVLEDIPLEGLYLSVHNDPESPFLWPEIHHIVFDPSTLE